MQFTKYYSDLIKAYGIPQLTVEQFQKVMNIVVLESRIAEQNLISKRLTGDAKVMVGKRNYSSYNQLNNLTQRKEPKELFEEIIRAESD
ncbi:hypothetical protein [Winogradskyella aurantiaca]|uniref:hypothetical protein n=1 Tax=Winogradskyella aurantiaca TaxID=2219558 RepID=UPI000E1CDD91|nr:hypothetical protein [Winogradskyella aurantiaca]